MIVVIDGNIGSGKSTQVEMLKDLYTVHREPLDQWGNLLKWFYADPKRWALTFQMKVLKCFNALKDDPATTTIVERYPREFSLCILEVVVRRRYGASRGTGYLQQLLHHVYPRHIDLSPMSARKMRGAFPKPRTARR